MQRKLSSFTFGKSPKKEPSTPDNSPNLKTVTKNKKFLETRKTFISLQKETKFTKETLEKLASGFYMAHPDGKMLKDEFIRENLESKGGVKELWSSVFDLMDADGNGYIDIHEFLLANSIAATGSIETKVAWMFNLFDEDKSGTLEEEEVKNFVDMLLKTNTNMSENTKNRQKFVEKLYSVLDEEKNGEVTLDDFIRVARSNAQLSDLVNTYTETIRYEIDFNNKKSNNIETKNFESQVAGHSGGIKSIIKKGKQIWKPLNQTEYEFYEEIKSSNSKVKDFIVGYYGRTFIDYTSDKQIGQIVHYIMIDDLTCDMKQPCIIDLKMGTREYSDHDSKKKQIQKVILSSVTSSNTLGFRICGMKVWKVKEKYYGTQSKKKALLLNTNQVEESLISFIDNGKLIRFDVYKIALKKLNKIKEWFEEQTDYQFYASSILIIYEGDMNDNIVANDDNVIVKMIDFAHTQKTKNSNNHDDSYLFGLNQLTSRLNDIIDEKLKYRKNGKGILVYPEVEQLNNSISSMQNNIDSIIAKNSNVGSTMQVQKRFEMKLKEKDEIINLLNNEIQLLNDHILKEMNQLKNEKDLIDLYETKLLERDYRLNNLEMMMMMNTKSDIINNHIIKENESSSNDDELINLKSIINLKEEIINEKNTLIKSLMENNEMLKRKNEELKQLNEKTMIYSSILNLKNEFEEMKNRNEMNLNLKQDEINKLKEEMKMERERFELELNKLKEEKQVEISQTL